MSRQTRDDACAQVALGRVSSLAGGCTREYLEGLREHLYDWIRVVEERMSKDAEAEALRDIDELRDEEIERQEDEREHHKSHFQD